MGVEEVRLGQDYGHDMESHRMGEKTVIEEFQKNGFDYVGSRTSSTTLPDPHTDFMEGQRHLADRMLKFSKPGEPAPPGRPPRAVPGRQSWIRRRVLSMGLIGCGRVAMNVYIPSIARISDARIVAFAEPDEERRSPAPRGFLGPRAGESIRSPGHGRD